MANAEYYFEKDKSYIISFDTPNTGVQVYLQGQGKSVNYTYEKYSTALCDGKRHSFKVTAIETKVTKVTWGLILRETTTNNTDSGLLSNLMIEEVENSSTTSTDYEEHQEDNYILPIQQEMLQNDYFDLKTLEEVHNWSEINVSELLSKDIAIGSASTEQYYVFQIPLGNENQIAEKVLCEKLKFLGFEKATNQREEEGIAINQDAKRFGRIWIKASRLSEKSISAFLSWCAEENIIVKALIEDNETRLPMTSEQIEIIKQLSNLALFDGTNNIITTEDIALLKLKYVVDTKTYIDNQIADMQNQLNTINELLSTTATSSILLDNLQTDLESEVM